MRPFLTGKLPAHGDFVARGLAASERDAWDGWAAAALDALRTAAGDGFDAAHAQAPAWRFVARGEADWRAGAAAPSVDSVGRRFLLVLGAGGLSASTAAAAGVTLAEAAEALIYDALGQALDADALLAAADVRLAEAAQGARAAAAGLDAEPRGEGAWWSLGAGGDPPAPVAGRWAPADLFARGLASIVPAPLEAVA